METQNATLADALGKLLDRNKNFAAQFVYGTLRCGGFNFDLASEGVVLASLNCTAQGKIYFVDWRGGYPVAKFNEAGEITGDILVFNTDTRAYNTVCRMEQGAGYELVIVPVTLPDGSVIEAETWHYLYYPQGAEIVSGDWREEAFL